MESAAKYIWTYEVRFVPGLLQSRPYAEAVIRSAHRDEEQACRLVDVRMRRQQMLLQRGTPKLWAIVEYAALDDGLGDRGVMQDQIDFLIWASKRPNVKIQVLMPGAGGLAFRGDSFSILQLADSEVVYQEHLDCAHFSEGRKASELYRLAMSELVILADEPRKARRTLEEISRRIRTG
ncbi:DUF5753 domain-containing protein [Actinoplanes sp. NPDC024001]|uniref:DUF5753 domain-containing protein n=1 Tax=Actinoplanes sp. NPDC024001 TaxID=3154598 RepID=UPI0033F346CC